MKASRCRNERQEDLAGGEAGSKEGEGKTSANLSSLNNFNADSEALVAHLL